MGKILDNISMQGLTGMVGKVLVYRMVHGELIVSKRPAKRKKPTAHQLKTKQEFNYAVRYAKHQVQIPERKELYAKKIGKKLTSAYTVALADFLNPPIINNIFSYDYHGKIGDTITIDAEDDFEVISVTVTIYNSHGVIIEKGNATLMETLYWAYTTTVENENLVGTKIVVKASDRPKHVVEKEVLIGA